MKKNKIGIIGRIAEGANLYDGQTVLTVNFKNELEKMDKNKIYCVDTYKYKKRFIICMFQTLICLFKCDDIFILLSKNGLTFYLPFLYYLNKIFKRNLYHRVIGGNLDKYVEQNPKWIKYLNSFKYNYVELESLANKLYKLGVTNAKDSPNFKNIKILCENELEKYNKETFNFCTFSRVTKDKGITDAINAIVKIREKYKVCLDIYGPVADEYSEEFFSLVEKYECINYKGIANPNKSVEILKEYYALLFPTFWKGEGFPGTLIDALSSGIPTIATDWNYNSEIIKENYTGFCYNVEKKEDLSKLIESIIKDKDKNYEMKKNCIKEAKKYEPQIVVGKIYKDIISNRK